MSSKPSARRRNEYIPAGVGGAAGGTGIIAFVDTLSLSPSVKHAVLLLIPWLTLILIFGFNVLFRNMRYLQQERMINVHLAKAKLHRDSIINDPNSTEEEKHAVRLWYATVQEYKRQFHEGVLQAVATEEHVPNLNPGRRR